MADALDILNPNNPLLDSEEEDDDFEPGMEMLSTTESTRGTRDKRRTVCENEKWEGRNR